MNESYRFETQPAQMEHGPDIDTLSPPLTEAPESYPVPATIDTAEPSRQLEVIQETYDQVFEEPIAEQERQIEATQGESERLAETVETLEASLPEVLASADGEKVRTLTTQLNDIDRRRIGLIQQNVYQENEVQFRRNEAAAFEAERNEIIQQLIDLVAEILSQARQELGRLKGTVEVTRFQVGFSREEQQQALFELGSLEEQFVSFQEAQSGQAELTDTFDTALQRIATARTDIESQQREQEVRLAASEDEVLLIEGKVSGYESELDTLRGQLAIEDMRDGEELEEDISNEPLVPSDELAEENITDAEFVPIENEVSSGSPTVNPNLEVTGQ